MPRAAIIHSAVQGIRFDLFLKTGLIFASVQALTIFVSQRLKPLTATSPITVQSPGEVVNFVIYLLAATLIFLLLIKFTRTRKTLKIFWFLAIFSGLQLFLGIVMRTDFALLLTLVIVALYWKAPTIYLHNAILVLALPAISALFGTQIAPWAVVGLLILFSVYDVIAVYVTKHMVKMAHAFISEKVIPGVIISEKKVDPTQYVGEVTIGSGFSVLGSGDFVFPAILVSAASLDNLLSGFIVAGFSLVGLLLTHALFFSQKERQPMPALPPIAGMTIIGFLLSKLLQL